MSITFIGAGTPIINDVTAQNVGISGAPHVDTLTGDFMFCVLGRDEVPDPWDNPPANGWTLIAQRANTGGRNYRLLAAYKFATSDSEGSATFTGTDIATNIENNGAILTFRGVDPATPLDVVYVEANHSQNIQNATNPTTHPYNSITTATGNAVVLVIEHLNNGSVQDIQSPAGYTPLFNHISNVAGNVQVWAKEVPVAGLESPGASGSAVSVTTMDGGSFTIALKPLVVTGPTINSVDSDNQVREGQANVAIAWSNGSASGNTLTISPTNDINDVNAITPTITSESATGCTVPGPISFPAGVAEGGNSYWFLTDSGATDSAGLTVIRSDLTPGAFGFVDQTDVTVSTVTTSASITVSGIDDLSPISVTGGEYSINGGAFTAIAGTVSNGDTVQARHTSSASNSTAVNTTVTIGGVSDIFTSTTIAAALALDFSGASNVFKNNAGTVLANLTGIVADIYLASSGDRVGARKTGIATDSNGNIGNISDASLTAVPHKIVITFAEGNVAIVRSKTPA